MACRCTARFGQGLFPLVITLLIWAVGGLATAGSSPASAGANPPAASTPTGPHLRPDGHITLAWLYGGSTADYMSQVEAAAGLTTLSPTWWYLDEDDPGGLEIGTDDELVQWAHGRGQAVWPLLGNHIDPDLTDQVLRDDGLRRRLLDAVVSETRRSGVDGVNVDFENLHDRTAVLLTQFVAELKQALPDLVISVDVTAMTDTWVLGNWSTAFDREGLGQVADYVMLMAYDQHNSLRRDGPVAGLDWVTESTDFLLRTVPAHKVVLGIPLYSRDWATDPEARDGIDLDATLGMAAMGARMAERSQGVMYDEAAGQDVHTYTDDRGRPHRVWLEDVASLQRKTALLSSHGLAGVAAWRAGFEQPEVWTALDQQIASIPAPQQAVASAEGSGASAADAGAPAGDAVAPPLPQDGEAVEAAAPDAQTPDADAGTGGGSAGTDAGPAAGVLTDEPGMPLASGDSAPSQGDALRITAAALLTALVAGHVVSYRRRR